MNPRTVDEGPPADWREFVRDTLHVMSMVGKLNGVLASAIVVPFAAIEFVLMAYGLLPDWTYIDILRPAFVIYGAFLGYTLVCAPTIYWAYRFNSSGPEKS